MRAEKNHVIFIAACCCLLAAPGIVCTYVAGSGATVEITSRVSLIAYDVAAVDITGSTTNITWMTNGPSNSTVEFGLTTSYDLSKTDSEMVASHTVTLEGLSVGQEYHYRVLSSDSAGTLYTSPDFTFTTPGGGSQISNSGGGDGGSSTMGIIVGMPVVDLMANPSSFQILSADTIPLTADNLVAEPVVIVSADRSASLSIDKDAQLLDREGNPLNSISLTRIATKDVPTVSEGSLFVFSGYAYQVEPSGARFSPPIALKITTTPEEWNLISGKDLSIQYYNPVSGLWEELPTTTDPATHAVTTMLAHASDYGLFINPISPRSPPAIITTTTMPSRIGPVPGVPIWSGWISAVQLIASITTIVVIGSVGLFLYRKRNGYKSK